VFVQLGNRRLVRDERWLLHDDGRVYDIRRDPLERNNVARELKGDSGAAIEKLRRVLTDLGGAQSQVPGRRAASVAAEVEAGEL
jgi:hypothetical protein